jgi:hypothetical protein
VNAPARQSLKIFISYSRKDQVFVDDLLLGLTACGFEPYLDKHDIALGEAWEDRLVSLILSADSMVFVVSPDSVASTRCEWEIERAEHLRKRIFPVVCRPVSESAVPKRLGRLNYVFFCGDGFSFARSLADLSSALKVDLDWIREHTRLASLAERWRLKERLPSQVLPGEEVPAAIHWLSISPGQGAEPTALQREFIEVSEKAERERIVAELARDAAIKDSEVRHQAAVLRAQSLRRYLVLAASAFVLVMVVFVFLLWQRQVEAELIAAENAQLRAEAEKDKAFTRLDASLAGSSNTPGASTPGQIDAGTTSLVSLISSKTLDEISAAETGGRNRYEATFAKPLWPGGESGINIGIGYDLGFTSKADIAADWGGLLDQKSLDALLSVQGVRGSQAQALAKALEGVHIPWDAANRVLKLKVLPRYVKLLLDAVPGVTELPPDSFGALLSLVFNRGSRCFNASEDRCAEMRKIRDLVANKEFEDVPEQIRLMKRLYPDIMGLKMRREREAKLFEEGLADAKPARTQRITSKQGIWNPS